MTGYSEVIRFEEDVFTACEALHGPEVGFEEIISANPVSCSGLTIVEVDQNTSGTLSLTATVALLTTDIPTPYIGNPLSPSKRGLDY